MLDLISPAAATFFACLLVVLALRPASVHRTVPAVGGVAIFLAIMLGIGFAPTAPTLGVFLAACALLVTTGLLDDRFDLSPWTRFGAQAIVAILMVAESGISIVTLGDLLGTGTVGLSGFASYALTVLVTVAAINSFNTLDAMDGLAGAMALIALAGVAYLATGAGLAYEAGAALTFIGAVTAFLVFNVPARFNRPMRCLLGDSGSMLIGFAVVWLCVRVSQQAPGTTAPVTMLWLIALPLYELTWTTLRRLLRGVPPFMADRDDFHHLLIRSGLGVQGALTVFVALATLLAAIGIAVNGLDVPDVVSLGLFVAAALGVAWLMSHAEVLVRIIPAGLRGRGVASSPRNAGGVSTL